MWDAASSTQCHGAHEFPSCLCRRYPKVGSCYREQRSPRLALELFWVWERLELCCRVIHGLHLLTLIYWEQQDLVSSKRTLGTKGQRALGLGNSRAARGQGAELVMFTAAALPAKTSFLSVRGCCVVQWLCWLLQLPQLCTHWGKPSLCHTIAAVEHQRDTGVLGSSG